MIRELVPVPILYVIGPTISGPNLTFEHRDGITGRAAELDHPPIPTKSWSAGRNCRLFPKILQRFLIEKASPIH